jgi:gas vesicle structural protein
MGVEKLPSTSSLIEVLDRVVDKGIVVDGWRRISLAGIDLIRIKVRGIVYGFIWLPRWAQLMIVISLLLITAWAVELLSSL